MFSRNQYHNDYYLQQYRMDQLNMGNPYFPVSPYPNFQTPYQNFQTPYSNSYFQPQEAMPPYYQSIHGGLNFHQSAYQPSYASPFLGGKNQIKSIFQNPLEPKDPYAQQMQMPNHAMNYNPYPKPNVVPRPNGGIGSIMNSFKGQDGNIDLNKMVNTAGQMMNAVSQVSAMVKGLGGMFKV